MRINVYSMLVSAVLLTPFSVPAQQENSATAATPTQPTTVEETPAAPPAIDPTQAAQNEAVQTVDAANEAEAKPAEAPATETSGKIPAAPSDKGLIVFFRPSKFTGGAIGFKVREGDKELGKLRSGNYFIHLAEPGTHEYTVHSEAKDVIALEVEEGETYFVQGTITMGVFAGRPNLSPSDASTFNGMADKLKLRE